MDGWMFLLRGVFLFGLGDLVWGCFYVFFIGLWGGKREGWDGGDHHHSCWQQEIEAKIATTNGG
jgi:hypothetical protein